MIYTTLKNGHFIKLPVASVVVLLVVVVPDLLNKPKMDHILKNV